MFDICCGGVIGSFMKKKDSDKPYLFRKNRCTFCKNKSSYEWKYSFDKNYLLDSLLENQRTAKKAMSLGLITNIGLKEKDLAGIVHRIFIHGTKNNITLTHNELKSVISSKMKSNAYIIKKQAQTITIHGYGFGHNTGLCQLGARELVAKGWNFKEILEFYFPKTKLMRLKVL
jgi:stage II sporulation protein D